ncbi:YbjC family protein [Atlantibacter sp.]|uniref:YbjC family protein n=1 Tax=Atlantibacter sp. TaxID=1903473 RepID=UPI0028A8F0BA|nr:YbjC family protein [Atlantibacter sp.]
MRSLGALPKPVLVLEAVGMVLLGLAWLSLKDYVDLPAPFNSNTWGIVMVFLGVLLMLPAAVALVWNMGQNMAPLLFKSSAKSKTSQDKDSHHDANH